MSKELNKAPVEQAGGDERAAFFKHLIGRHPAHETEIVRVVEHNHAAWKAWQASRAALRVELPSEKEESNANYRFSEYSHSRAQGFNDCLDRVTEALQQAGIEVK
ncbi:TPA: hypothetical protein ONA95_004778 [Pseudomonas aeruginosa]|nr:hypothetical protein [Pseudomonas aeruginosa]HBO4036379.1 hypothetical protein [Pseudomonas aeruginosa]HBO4112458.1 hypothetical protein [Pseudomonas aeruginosa]HCR1670292.1 hypothetical protein [Pseudomonas aeruginosa]